MNLQELIDEKIKEFQGIKIIKERFNIKEPIYGNENAVDLSCLIHFLRQSLQDIAQKEYSRGAREALKMERKEKYERATLIGSMKVMESRFIPAGEVWVHKVHLPPTRKGK